MKRPDERKWKKAWSATAGVHVPDDPYRRRTASYRLRSRRSIDSPFFFFCLLCEIDQRAAAGRVVPCVITSISFCQSIKHLQLYDGSVFASFSQRTDSISQCFYSCRSGGRILKISVFYCSLQLLCSFKAFYRQNREIQK